MADITGTLQQLTSKLQFITPDQLQEMLSVPSFDQFSAQFSNILPDKLVQLAQDGAQNILNPTNLANQISQTAQQVLPQIAEQATSQLQSLVGSLPQQVQGLATSVDLQQLGAQLSDVAEQTATTVSNQMVSALEQNIQTGELSNLAQAAQSSIANVSLSPKGIRDLADPVALAQQAQQLAQAAPGSIAGAASLMAEQLAENPVFSKSGQINFQQLGSPVQSGNNAQGYQRAAYVSTYWAQGPGSDYNTAAGKSFTGKKPVEGVSCAVDGRLITIGSQIIIPGLGTRTATDIAGASKGRPERKDQLPVILVYFNSKKKAEMAKLNRNLAVTVIPPQTKYVYSRYAPPGYGPP